MRKKLFSTTRLTKDLCTIGNACIARPPFIITVVFKIVLKSLRSFSREEKLLKMRLTKRRMDLHLTKKTYGPLAMLVLLRLPRFCYRFCNFLTEIELLLTTQVNLFGDAFNTETSGHQRTLGNPFDEPIV